MAGVKRDEVDGALKSGMTVGECVTDGSCERA